MQLKISKQATKIVIIAIAIFLVALGIRLYDLNGTGATWDEWGYFTPALYYYTAIKQGSSSPEYWKVNNEHPPLAKYIYVYAYSKDERFLNVLQGKAQRQDYFTGDIYRNGRIASAVLNSLTVVVLFIYASRYFGAVVGIISSMILMLLPQFLGHGKIAALDSPTAFFYTLAVFAFHYAIEKDSWKSWILAWIATGLAISTKYSNFTLFIMFGVIYVIWKFPEMLLKKRPVWHWKTALLPVVALLLLFAMWPWLWHNPIENFKESVAHWTGSPPKEFFLGEAREAPLYYFLVYLFATTPLIVLILVLYGLFRIVRSRNLVSWILLIWFLTPLLWSFSTGVQDGMRYIYVIFPPLALVAGVGLRNLPKWRWMFFAVIIFLVIANIRVHPYYIDYYNILVQGPKGVYDNKMLEFGWWGEGKKEMIEWINKNAELNAIVGTKFSPYIDISGWRQDIRFVDLELINYSGHLDYVATNTYWEWYNEYYDPIPPRIKDLENYTLVKTVSVMEAPIVKIYKNE